MKDVYDEKNEESCSSHENSESNSSSDESDDKKFATRKVSRTSNRQRSKIKKKSKVHKKKVKNSTVKEKQPVKMEVKAVTEISVKAVSLEKKIDPETHMECQDHLQNAIDYLRKYQKDSIEVGDSEPDNTHTENHDVDDDNSRPRSEKVSSSFGSKYVKNEPKLQICNLQICKE